LSASPDLDVLAGTTRLFWRSRGFFERVQAHFRVLPRPWPTPQDLIFVTANVAIRRALLERLGGFRPLRVGEDSELAGRIALSGARVAFDEDWFVRHDPESFRSKLRKYWRYGFTNVALHERTTTPVAFANLLQARRRLHVRNARFNYRRAMAEADGFSDSRASRLAAVLAVTCVQIAYYDGCAVGARSRRVRPPA
jgi:GT2 family glycosyltransferase